MGSGQLERWAWWITASNGVWMLQTQAVDYRGRAREDEDALETSGDLRKSGCARARRLLEITMEVPVVGQ